MRPRLFGCADPLVSCGSKMRQPLDMTKVNAALKLVEAKVSPAEAARQLGIGRSTIYRGMSVVRAG